MARASNTDTRRAQIVAGLAAEMAERGYDGASIGRIARRAGLTQGLVHYHFGSKIEILEALLADLVAGHSLRLAEALRQVGDDPRAQVDAFIDLHLATGASADAATMACWVMLAGEALRHPEVRQGYGDALTMWADQLTEIIEHGVRVGAFSCTDARAAAAALLATIQGYYVIAATARDVLPPGSAARSTKQMAGGLLGSRS